MLDIDGIIYAPLPNGEAAPRGGVIVQLIGSDTGDAWEEVARSGPSADPSGAYTLALPSAHHRDPTVRPAARAVVGDDADDGPARGLSRVAGRLQDPTGEPVAGAIVRISATLGSSQVEAARDTSEPNPNHQYLAE